MPDGTGEELETSLSTEGQDYIRSLSIESSENVTIRFDRKNRVILNYWRVVRFKHIKVRVWRSLPPGTLGLRSGHPPNPKVALKRSAWTVWWWLRNRYRTGYSSSISPRNIPMLPWERGSLPTVSLSWTYRLNSPANDPIPAEKGQSYNGIVFSEIYVTNSAASGMEKIHAAWID